MDKMQKLSSNITDKKQAKTNISMLNFPEEKDVIVLDGTSLIDTTLEELLADHYLKGACLTSMVKEIDVAKKIPGPKDFPIYGVTDLEKENRLHSTERHEQIQRLVLLSNSDIRLCGNLNVHKSTLNRVKNLTIRTDLADIGLVVMKHYLLQILVDLDDDKLTKQSINHYDFFREFVPYVAKHQFKKALNKYDPRSNEDQFDHMVHRIMQPTQTVLKKDFIKVHVHIVPQDQSKMKKKHPLFFCRLVDDDTYAYAK
jgi:hypothetical protein